MSGTVGQGYDVFISYSHQDSAWVFEQLVSRLEGAGLHVCIDERDFAIGVSSLLNMERAVDSSRHTLLVLTPDWVASEWTEFESLLASTADPAGRRRKIIPLMVKQCEPPSRIAMLTWADFRDAQGHERQFNRLVSQLQAMSGTSAPLNQLSPNTKQTDHAIELPYGTVPPASPFYMDRQADHECQDYFKPGRSVTVYIQAPRQMGKSSLMQRIDYLTKATGKFEIAYIDCEKFTTEQLHNLDVFLLEFCYMVSEALEVPESIEQYWSSSRRSSLIKCSNYIAKHIVPTLNKPLIVAMDEVERVLDTPFRNDFFGMLRAWHNDRAHDANMAKVSLFLSSSTEPQLFIDNPNQSPFNVAQPIALNDFAYEEVQQLNQRHPSALTESQLRELMNLVEGHPFLTRLALYLTATQQYDFVRLRQNATSEDGPFGSHLDHFWRSIAEFPELRQALVQIIRHQTYPADKVYYRLKGAGLVKRVAGKVVMRNQLYERYFSGRLNG